MDQDAATKGGEQTAYGEHGGHPKRGRPPATRSSTGAPSEQVRALMFIQRFEDSLNDRMDALDSLR